MWTAALIGLFHGINPGMGWLFALYRALHRQRRAELLFSLLPITIGHAASVGLVVLILVALRSTLPIQPVRYASAGVVLAFGLYRLVRYYRHMRWSGLNLSAWDLGVWSFLGATSHGSGLMLAPLALGAPGGRATLLLVAVHTATMLLAMLAMAMAVYKTVNMSRLRRFWINFDLLWAGSLIVVGVLAFVAAWGHSHA